MHTCVTGGGGGGKGLGVGGGEELGGGFGGLGDTDGAVPIVVDGVETAATPMIAGIDSESCCVNCVAVGPVIELIAAMMSSEGPAVRVAT